MPVLDSIKRQTAVEAMTDDFWRLTTEGVIIVIISTFRGVLVNVDHVVSSYDSARTVTVVQTVVKEQVSYHPDETYASRKCYRHLQKGQIVGSHCTTLNRLATCPINFCMQLTSEQRGNQGVLEFLCASRKYPNETLRLTLTATIALDARKLLDA